jgi:hypothetical protein
MVLVLAACGPISTVDHLCNLQVEDPIDRMDLRIVLRSSESRKTIFLLMALFVISISA